MPSFRQNKRLQILLFLSALLLYSVGLWWGLPYAAPPNGIQAWGPDELAPLGPVAELYNTFYLHRSPYNPQYPLFHYFVQAMFVAPYLILLRLTGGLSTPATAYPFGLSDPVSSLATMTLLARVPSLLMGAGTVVAAYHTGRILWKRVHGLIAAIAVMLSYPMSYYSRTSNVEMGALFWTSLGLLIVAICARDSLTPARAAWLGVFAALACATKDSYYVPFVVPGIVLAYRSYSRRGDWRSPLVGLFSAVATYVVASGLIFNLQRFREHLTFISHGSDNSFYFTNPATIAGYLSIVQATAHYVKESLGLPMAIFGIAGVILCFWRDRITLLFAATIPSLFLFVLLPVRFVLFRFVVIVTYALAFYAAYFLAELLVTRRLPAILCLIAALGWAGVRALDLTYQMVTDSRYAAGRWFSRNVRSGQRIGYFGTPQKLPRFPEGSVPEMLKPAQIPTTGVEFILLIPFREFEPGEDRAVPENLYRSFCDGSAGYRYVYGVQSSSLFTEKPLTFVNPPVRVFARSDRADVIEKAGASKRLLPCP